jgi:hypothetical protein
MAETVIATFQSQQILFPIRHQSGLKIEKDFGMVPMNQMA